MKTKLLKKLHKRYSWYFNKEGFPVLLNHKKERVILYDIEYCMNLNNYTPEDVLVKIKVPYQEWALRIMKRDILTSFGWDIERVRYKIAKNKLKSKLRNDRQN